MLHVKRSERGLDASSVIVLLFVERRVGATVFEEGVPAAAPEDELDDVVDETTLESGREV